MHLYTGSLVCFLSLLLKCKLSQQELQRISEFSIYLKLLHLCLPQDIQATNVYHVSNHMFTMCLPCVSSCVSAMSRRTPSPIPLVEVELSGEAESSKMPTMKYKTQIKLSATKQPWVVLWKGLTKSGEQGKTALKQQELGSNLQETFNLRVEHTQRTCGRE